jgi:putative molybdopterin biosynthesis protein
MLEDSALTPLEVAEILKISKNTVYELIKRGQLNGYKVGKKIRVDKSDVEAYKNSTKNKTSNNQTNISIDKDYNLASCDLKNNAAFVISGQDIMLDILARYLEKHPKGTQALRSYEGSYNGLYALYNGKVSAATTHLWDGDTGEYNIPYVKRMLPGTPAVIVHLAERMQGFYVAKGNKKGVRDWKDIVRPDIKIINREKGSGVRILLDEKLRKMGISPSTINGYTLECSSHLAVASSISRGIADLGIGCEKSGLQVKDIDFIPLQSERYELVIRKEDFIKPIFQAIFEIINSEEYKTEIEGIGGYNISQMRKIVAET